MSLQDLKDMITRHEGKRLKPYVDTVGKITIGVGRNLTDNGISDRECDTMLDSDIANATVDLLHALPWVADLSEVRQHVLIDMCFNMGIDRLLGFKNMLVAAQEGNWDEMQNQMLDSTWARQVGPRAIELARMAKTNSL